MSAEEKKKSEHVTSPAHVATARSAASQRRHALEENTLVHQLGKIAGGFKDPSRTTWLFLLIVALVIGLVYVWRYFAKSSAEKNSARWFQAMRVMDGEQVTPPPTAEPKTPLTPEQELEKFATNKENEGTVQARIANFYIARMNLAEGEKLLGIKREEARAKVRKATELYEKLIPQATDSDVLRQEAILGSAKGREMLEEYSKALGYYSQLVKEYPKSEFLEQAKDGEARLKEDSPTRKELEALAAALKARAGQ